MLLEQIHKLQQKVVHLMKQYVELDHQIVDELYEIKVYPILYLVKNLHVLLMLIYHEQLNEIKFYQVNLFYELLLELYHIIYLINVVLLKGMLDENHENHLIIYQLCLAKNQLLHLKIFINKSLIYVF
jgi:hypothetical protein